MSGLSPAIAAKLREKPHRILVTGSSGWLGRATLDLLHKALGADFHERVRCFGSRPLSLPLSASGTIEQRPLAELGDLANEPSLLLHFAFLTKDRAEQMDEARYRAANGEIRGTVLNALDAIGTEAVFVTSSGAAALAEDPSASAAMRLYGSLKRDDEFAFAHWADTRAKRLVLARIHNLSGPHVNKVRAYALASFITDALAGGPIAIRAQHDVVRGYVAIRELMSLALSLLLGGDRGIIRFDTGGEPVELGALAQAVAAQCGGCPVERADRMAGGDMYLGDRAEYRSLLQAEGIEEVPLALQIAETIEFLSKRRQ